MFKKFFYSQNTRQTDDTASGPNRLKYLSLLNLFKQTYREWILVERDKIKESETPADLLRAYNSAVTTEFDKLKSQEPQKYQDLQDLLHDLKEQAKLSFVDQTEGVQAA